MSYTYAKITADTQHPMVKAARITTFEVYAPRFILAELNTHRVLAKSAASSRAIPVKKRIEMVEKDCYIPASFGKNKPGMQADEPIRDQDDAQWMWLSARNAAVIYAQELAALEVHKQLANRILEPYAYFHGVVTSTEWTNFFKLRMSSSAQPEFRELAEKMFEALHASEPNEAELHLPWLSDIDQSGYTERELFNISAARSARVSYKTHDGKPFDLDKDLFLCASLISDGHMSPFDHAARADTVTYCDDPSGKAPHEHHWDNPEAHRQFWGWVPDRVNIERSIDLPSSRRSSWEKIPMCDQV